MSRVLFSTDVSSLYPSLICEYGYSSRNQPDANLYKELKAKRIAAKHSGDKKVANALKLPLNTYYGSLGAPGNALQDDLMRISVCISGQSVMFILLHDIRLVPTVRCVAVNTDSIEIEIDEEYLPQLQSVLEHWQQQYRLELEDEYVLKLVMRDINNYVAILKTDKGLEVKCKGGCFAGCPKIKIHPDGKLETIYKHDFKANSKVIVGEAVLKNLLFNIPVETTINKCNDMEAFQVVGHVGNTYEKCVLTTKDGDIELQRNNRIYAGKKPSGEIFKVKSNGRRDRLANQPTNPLIDNANVYSIEDIDKSWYIKLAKTWVNDFKGVTRLEEYKKEELLKLAAEKGIEVDKKIKKSDLLKLLEEQLDNPFETKESESVIMKDENKERALTVFERVNNLKADIMNIDFVLDCVMPTNLGGKEYASISQYYKVINELSIRHGLLFRWDVYHVSEIEKDLFKPMGKTPQHVVTVKCQATFTDVITGETVCYDAYAAGSDICDKMVSGASSMAFRNWFDKNFTPKHLSEDIFGSDEEVVETTEKTVAPKVPTYIPAEKKEEIKQEVVSTVQHESNDDEDAKDVVNKIMKVRELLGDQTWGEKSIAKLISGDISSSEILAMSLKVDNKLESLGVK